MTIDSARPEPADIDRRLIEAEHTLDAIRRGSVDAVVVHAATGPQVFSLEGPDQPFRTFVERMQEGALTLADTGTILYANQHFATLVDRSAESLVGVPIATLMPPEYSSTCERLIREGMDRPTKGTVYLLAGEQSMPVQLTLSPLYNGQPPTCCAVVFNLRDREESERAKVAREAAEQATAAKDRFLAVLSHELRSPLSTIMGWAQVLLARTDLDETCRLAVQTIERNAHAQARLIGELLDVSRIVAGKLHFEFETVDFKQIVAGAVASARLSMEKELELRVELVDGEVWVLGDAMRLQQVVSNLLHNATKFTRADGLVEIALRVDEHSAVLEVKDDGIGIEPSELGPIFEVFRQGEFSVKQRKGGLGLGLTIARQLVEAHRGEITATSPGRDRGACFKVRLPRITEPAIAGAVSVSDTGTLRNVRVLLVDDDSDILDLMRYLLGLAGASVSPVSSSAAALRLLRPDAFDVIVSDIGLPEQDGLAMMREIRARGYAEDKLPAIALTGYASHTDARLAKAAGFQLHLAKPIDTEELVRAIARLAKSAH